MYSWCTHSVTALQLSNVRETECCLPRWTASHFPAEVSCRHIVKKDKRTCSIKQMSPKPLQVTDTAGCSHFCNSFLYSCFDVMAVLLFKARESPTRAGDVSLVNVVS